MLPDMAQPPSAATGGTSPAAPGPPTGGPRGLYALKPWYARRLAAGVRWAVRRRVSPDAFTVAGVLAAVAAGVAIALGWWLAALVLLALRLAGANLDGQVARARGVSRPWGFTLNEVGDRASDLAMVTGLAVLAAREPSNLLTTAELTSLVWVLLAGLAATLPTFASLAVAGAGGPRANGGPLGKTERCLLAVVATAVPAWLPVLSMLIVVGSIATAVLRLRAGRRALGHASHPGDGAGDQVG